MADVGDYLVTELSGTEAEPPRQYLLAGDSFNDKFDVPSVPEVVEHAPSARAKSAFGKTPKEKG